jgi:hypothetical protein
VLIECGNLNNRTDARMLVTARFQRRVARALTAAIVGSSPSAARFWAPACAVIGQGRAGRVGQLRGG